ncbi:phenylalanine ammonia-lyase [Amniculicola lignicola CBS 123094]|uniref:Phenylalanine ammonia-lyase n=1 Tax=Amniculicola lignicola CBS 123094 TaxID=1392246 RepID=A0A6A5WYC6_9PLEO|nr:phenylalanine ammonia-lyase [Amniculicola lignicola CBS 123094]
MHPADSLKPTPGLGAALNGTPHAKLTAALWKRATTEAHVIRIDGESLDIADVVAASNGCANVALAEDDDEVMARIERSVVVLDEQLARGETVYGVNTGYGGSADVRCGPHQMHSLQRAFLQHLNCGILPTPSADGRLDLPANTQSVLKEPWVRAAILIRANTVARGHSAVRASTIKTLLALLQKNVVPLIPVRGSISASGDLSPLSYVAAMLEGNPSIYCWIGPPGARQVVPANEALASANIQPIRWEPKETLGLVNGTAISCAVGSLALSAMHNIFALSQLLTAMNVEAILGTATSFAPFISSVRPHAGQAQVAATILSSLSGSKLASPVLGTHGHTLFQDRYSLRTVPQWLGPFLEDIMLAHEQLSVELNSTTDNPLIEPSNGDIYHGGNFQAASVTSAMEKVRLAAQAVGRMLFAQMTELFNPATNRGLPPNLCADDPSTSFTLKGVDTNMAAYMSELSFLANPVHNHVVNAEMGNQSLNSLALVSARYTDTATDILRLMCACALYGNCQALDLRAMMLRFTAAWESRVHASIHRKFAGLLFDVIESAKANIWKYMLDELLTTTTMDIKDRFTRIANGAKGAIIAELEHLKNNPSSMSSKDLLDLLGEWADENSDEGLQLFDEVRNEYFKAGDATDLLGKASKRLYHHVRRDLGVPMHRGVVDYPLSQALMNGHIDGHAKSSGTNGQEEKREEKREEKSIGQQISVIYESIKDDRIMDAVTECLRSVDEEK